MRRLNWLFVALLPVLFTACDQKSAAHLFLNAGFNLASASQASVAAELEQTTAVQPTTHDVPALAQALQRMRQLHDTQQTADQATKKRLIETIGQITALTDSLAQRAGATELEAAALAEIKWLALRAGAEVASEDYAAALTDCQQRLFGGRQTIERAARVSAKRFIRECLIQGRGHEETMRSLSLHSLAYPNCQMNVDLYVTVAEQLANEGHVALSVSIAQQGLDRCADLRDVHRLTAQLERIYAAHQGAPGVPMSFAGPLMNGERFELTSLQGNPVLVVFWASGCEVCREELPMIRDIHRLHRGLGLQIVSVSLDRDANALARFSQVHSLDWPHIIAEQPQQRGFDNPIARHYGVDSMPRTFLLDSAGVVVAANLKGQAEIESALGNLPALDTSGGE